MSAERFEIVEPVLRGVAPSLPEAARRVVELDRSTATVKPYWIIRDSETGRAYVVTPERLREIFSSPPSDSRRVDPLPLLEETSDPSELPTVAEWLERGAPMREIVPEPGPEADFDDRGPEIA